MAKKRAIVALLIASFVVMHGACRKQTADTREPEDATAQSLEQVAAGGMKQSDDDGLVPASGDWLMIHLPAEPPHLNPLVSQDYYASQIMANVFDSLLYRDPETLEMVPHVAESWQESEDHLVYLFTLRKGITFSDGVPLTAKDVVFTFNRLMDPKVDAAHLRNYYKNVTLCEAVDDYTVRYVCNEPYYRHLIMIGGLEIMPEHIYGKGNFNDHPNNRKPIGSGPYLLEAWETGQQVKLTRNEKYWGEAVKRPAYFDKKIYQIILDDNAAFQVLARGELDMEGLRPEDWVRRANTERFNELFNKYPYPRSAYSYIGWNARRPQFADHRTRRALTMLLDRETIRTTIFKGLSRTVAGTFMPGTPEFNETIEPLPFDPEQAGKLLAEVGWKDSDGDGVLDKEGIAFSFELLLPNANTDGEKVATLYKEELQRHGIVLNIRTLEWASLTELVDARNFDSVMMGWSMPPDPDPYQVWHSTQTEDGSNYVGFQNEEADQIIEQARVTFELDARVQLYKRFQEILHEEQPYTFMFQPLSLLVVSKRVHGIKIYPFGPDEIEWWVPQEQQRYGQE